MVEKELNKFLVSLKETSKDDHDPDSVFYITQSDIQVINFDDVKNEYIKPLGISKPPSSNDALYIDTSSGEYYFIEFKAGGIGPIKNVEIKFKIYDSLLIVLDILNKNISYSREKVHYILVYDKEKTHNSQHYKSSEDEKSKEFIQKHLALKGHTEIIRFDLERYKNLYFKNVHTYTFEEFEECFVEKFKV